jgi:molybdate transport system substrate-binding protein
MSTQPNHRRRGRAFIIVLAATALFLSPRAGADEALVAVATNFGEVAVLLQQRFEATSGDSLTLVTGSTGKLYAQIVHGAPYDVFLAADRRRPELLEEKGLAVDNSRYTYAIGRLVLWSPDPGRVVADGGETLAAGDFRALAIANPRLAPYGVAAAEVMAGLGLSDTLRDRLVMGENVGQAYSMVATGNAELGFVALSQILGREPGEDGSRWEVPTDMYAPIRQDAALLARADANRAATGFLRFLRSAEARSIILTSGYGIE